jgi:hypothetical protein
MPTLHRRLVLAALTVAAVAAGAPAAQAAPQPGLKAEFFDYTDLTGKVAERIDATVDFDWGLGEPVPGVGDTFSARWSGVVTPAHSETYTFVTRSDDGVRLWVDGDLVIDDWSLHAAAERSGQIALEAGQAYDLKLEYYDAVRHASVKLSWRSASQPKQVIPSSALATERAGAAPAIELPKEGGVTAVVGDGTLPTVLEPAAGDGALPVDGSIVSYGGPLPPPAPPVAGETFNASPEPGADVLVRRPADGQLLPLEQGASLPVGTRVDAREGGVDIQTAPAAGVDRVTQDAHFEGGMFRVGQSRRNGRVVTIDLMHGEFSEVCGPLSKRERRAIAKRRGVVARAAGSGRVLRRLWGKGKGRFRTRGRHAAATVRGTSWSVVDRCDSTSVFVLEGIVDVENLLTGKVVTLTAGEGYAAKP